MPDPDRLLRTLFKAHDLIRQTPGRRGHFIQLQDADEVLVAGDLHGHIGNFTAIHKAADLAKHPRRHLILQELIHGKARYPQGGDKSHQLLDLFAALKCQFPRQVHMLLGNHEMAQWVDRLVIKNDEDLNALFLDGIREGYAEKAKEIYDAYLRLFGVMPLAIRTTNRIMLSHSVPRAKHLDRFELRHLETDVFPQEDLGVGGTAYELLWGRDTREETCLIFLAKVDCEWVVSGHIACENGFAFPNSRQLIIDCCDSPAAYALIPTDRHLTADEFRAVVRVI